MLARHSLRPFISEDHYRAVVTIGSVDLTPLMLNGWIGVDLFFGTQRIPHRPTGVAEPRRHRQVLVQTRDAYSAGVLGVSGRRCCLDDRGGILERPRPALPLAHRHVAGLHRQHLRPCVLVARCRGKVLSAHAAGRIADRWAACDVDAGVVVDCALGAAHHDSRARRRRRPVPDTVPDLLSPYTEVHFT